MAKTDNQPACGPDNPHPLARRKTGLVWEGKYDEYGNRREVDVAGCAIAFRKKEDLDAWGRNNRSDDEEKQHEKP